jgi:Protein of unknown function (DUF2380)
MLTPVAKIALLLIAICSSPQLYAGVRIAVLNFELQDVSALPNTPQEQLRTAGMRPILEQALQKLGDYEIININPQNQADANAGMGYLFHFNDIVSKLGRQSGADWVVVAQHHKPSFLYSYVFAHLVAVNAPALNTHFEVELKGNHAEVTQRSLNALAKKINLYTGKAEVKQ